MNTQELQNMVAEILEVEPAQLQESSDLESFTAFDSVAKLSLMVGLSDFTGRPVSVPELMELHTYGDVLKLAGVGGGNGHQA